MKNLLFLNDQILSLIRLQPKKNKKLNIIYIYIYI